MSNFPFFWLNKFGISDKVASRRKNVSETTPGLVFVIFSINAEYGYHFEQWVHGLYSWLNFRFFTGSGRTEWFLCFSPVFGTLILWMTGVAGFPLEPEWYAAAYFTPFLWWDGLLWLLIFSAFRILAVILIFGLGYYIII